MVNYRWAVVLFGSMVLAFMACDPTELPEPTDGDPVFRLEGNLDSTAFELAAGVDNYFMFTELSPTNDGNLQSLSRLEELDCSTDCAPGWQFEFSGSIAALDSLLGVGQVPFIQPGTIITDTTYTLNLTANSSHSAGAPALSHEWAFYDGSAAGTSTVEKEIPGPGTYEVELTTITEGDCQSYTRKSFSFNTVQQGCEVSFTVDTTILFDSLIVATYDQGGAPEQLIWQDSIISQPGSIFSFLPPQGTGQFTLCLEGLFPDGCIAASCQTILLQQASVCRNRIDGGIETEINTVVIPGPSSGVVIRYQDEQGNLYSTAAGSQAPSFSFSIESAGPYENNSLGQPTLQLGIRFQCQLYDEAGAPWKTAEATGTIAVAIPD
ncbi:PKD domain-containing protein [Phaeodactylibacter xiamenensis]|uniref:PKD domain-containing protein n=1 Tax=Phaeodactylibacter xiamenensis TaxID=1524460 RepID=UPI0024AA01F8|nr:PKD domain-containing protein [Phaeodactylibacter xiamenensis]